MLQTYEFICGLDDTYDRAFIACLDKYVFNNELLNAIFIVI